MKTLQIDVARLLRLHALCVGKVAYKLGAKLPRDWFPGRDPDHKSDCSGYMDWMFQQLGIADMPDGSFVEKQWCVDQGFKPTTYDHNGAGCLDNHLRIGFIAPNPKKRKAGHVWLIYKGKTYECRGGVGVSSRPWSDYLGRATSCFVLT